MWLNKNDVYKTLNVSSTLNSSTLKNKDLKLLLNMDHLRFCLIDLTVKPIFFFPFGDRSEPACNRKSQQFILQNHKQSFPSNRSKALPLHLLAAQSPDLNRCHPVIHIDHRHAPTQLWGEIKALVVLLCGKAEACELKDAPWEWNTSRNSVCYAMMTTIRRELPKPF